MRTAYRHKAHLLALAAILAGSACAPSPVEGAFPLPDAAATWLNSRPLSAAAVRGKVVLVDFWTYSCINWRRTFPYLRAWEAAYAKRGLLIIGVHTPEFAFEQDARNVRRAVEEIGIAYSVALDNGYAVWNAFGNHSWPAIYLIDARGRVRYQHAGEGDEERTEAAIRALLVEAGNDLPPRRSAPLTADGVEAGADWTSLGSPETYIGYDRGANFASPGGVVYDRPRRYGLPARLQLNGWALSGVWTIGREAAVSTGANGRIVFRFHARDVHVVMGPAGSGRPVRFRVLLDGRAPGNAHGVDVDAGGRGVVTEPRLYQLLRQRAPIADR
jgi:thiol-disulfide isomerase/thioredoxin